jgi:hypothetical protein
MIYCELSVQGDDPHNVSIFGELQRAGWSTQTDLKWMVVLGKSGAPGLHTINICQDDDGVNVGYFRSATRVETFLQHLERSLGTASLDSEGP